MTTCRARADQCRRRRSGCGAACPSANGRSSAAGWRRSPARPRGPSGTGCCSESGRSRRGTSTAVEATNLDYQTLRNYAWVARSFECSAGGHAELPAPRRSRLAARGRAGPLARASGGQGALVAQRAAAPPAIASLERRADARCRRDRGARPAHPRGRAALDPRGGADQLPLPDWLRVVADAAAAEALDMARVGA